jgi:hypothetical protein
LFHVRFPFAQAIGQQSIAADPMPSRRTGRLKRFGGDFCKKKIFGPNPFAAPHRLSEQTHQKDDADETNPDTL